MKAKSKAKVGWFIFGLFLLFIPSINIIDIFPDFIAYFIFAGLLSYPAERVPYFEEAKDAFRKVGFVNLMRVPAFFLMIFIRMSNQQDTDMYALFTLIFGIIETILLLSAVKNLFEGLFYIGERTEVNSTIACVNFFGKNGLKMQPLTVFKLSGIFISARAFLAFVPEVFLMTSTDASGSNLVLHSNAVFYPVAFLLCFSLSLIIGIIWLIASAKYAGAIRREGLFRDAVDSLVTAERLPEIEKSLKLKRMTSALTWLTVASVFSLDIMFDNFGDVNILPRFIFSLLLFVGICKLCKNKKLIIPTIVLTALHTVVSLVGHGSLITFLDKWEYTDISLIQAAAEAYSPIIYLSALELILVCGLIVTVTIALREFILNNTKISPDSEKYSVPDRDFHRTLTVKSIVYAAIGIITQASKFISVLLNSNSTYLYTGSQDGGVSAIVTTALPWFGMFMTALSIAYIGYSLYYFGTIKDEIKMKYQ